MTAPSASVAAVQKALEDHQLVGVSMYDTACSCGGWPTLDGPSRHSDHIAVAAADAAVEAATPGIKAGTLREAARDLHFCAACANLLDACAERIEANR